MRPSHLLRRGSQCLLARHNFSTLPPLPGRFSGRYRPLRPVPHLQHVSRRYLFGVFQRPPRDVKQPELEPGYDVLLKFRSSETENVRPAPTEDLIEGFRTFFNTKNRSNRRVNSTQAFCALQLFKHLEQPGTRDALSATDITAALYALLRAPSDSAEYHLAFCKEIYNSLRRRALRRNPDQAEYFAPLDFKLHITALCQYGASTEASDLLSGYWRENQTSRRDKELWLLVLRGLAVEGKEKELLQQAEAAEAAGLEYAPGFHNIMTVFFAKRNDFDMTKTWFNKPIYKRMPASADTYLELATLLQREKKQKDWVTQVFRELSDGNPAKEHWDVIFQWAVVALGKGVDDIRHMLATMIRHNDQRGVRPDSATINGLIRAAVQIKNFLLADRFNQLGLEMDIYPDAQTFMMQLDYRIDAGDLSGAFSSFENLLDAAPPNTWENLPVIDKYIRASCSAPSLDTEKLLDVLGAVEKRYIEIEPATVVALCLTFLRSDQQYEVMDTLSLHTFQYSLDERQVVRDAFVRYCLDTRNSTRRVWDGYSLLRQFFPETSAADRISIMTSFFNARRRADMACWVFGHMRAHSNSSIRPTEDTYVECLEGLGRVPDMNNLKMVHNMLKMDTTIQMTTKVYNALMIAYTACDDGSRALDFWKDISNSAEGPSYRSLEIVLQACQGTPYRDDVARQIWEKLQRMEVEVPDFVYNSYCGVIAGHGHLEEAKKLISGMEASAGYRPTAMTLGITHNALLGQAFREDFADWAATEYPKLWAELQIKGRRTTVDGLSNINIQRVMRA